MTPEQFMECFGVVAEEPCGIDTLRKHVLSLAITGRLGTQSGGDEFAGDVIIRVLAEKGLSKTPERRALTPPFDLPRGWTWAHARDVFLSISDGDHQPPPKVESGVPFLVIGNVSKGELSFAEVRRVPSDYYDSLDPTRKPRRGDILFTLVGSYGIPVLVDTDQPFCIQRHMAIMRPPKATERKYLYYLLASSFVFNQATVVATGTAQKTVPLRGLREFLLPLPPIEEQHRIVAKVDQLMTMLDDLEQRQEKKRTAAIHVSKASLDSLVNAEDPDQLARAWEQVSSSFDVVTQPTSLPHLRTTLLKLAVQGKLGTGRKSDVSGSVYLDTIHQERGTDLDAQEISSPAPHWSRLPDNWTWACVGDICDIGTGSTPLKTNPEYYDGGHIPWVTSAETSLPVIREPRYFVTERAVKECRLRLYPAGTLLVAMYGQGKTRGQVAELAIDATINQACAALTFSGSTVFIREFVRLYLWSQYDELRELADGGAQPNLNLSKVRRAPIPIPPVAEQKRIVTKVIQLMTQLSSLENKLERQTSTARDLASMVTQFSHI